MLSYVVCLDKHISAPIELRLTHLGLMLIKVNRNERKKSNYYICRDEQTANAYTSLPDDPGDHGCYIVPGVLALQELPRSERISAGKNKHSLSRSGIPGALQEDED